MVGTSSSTNAERETGRPAMPPRVLLAKIGLDGHDRGEFRGQDVADQGKPQVAHEVMRGDGGGRTGRGERHEDEGVLEVDPLERLQEEGAHRSGKPWTGLDRAAPRHEQGSGR